MSIQEPQWIDVTTYVHGGYEVQLDIRAREGSPNQFRHRPYSFTGEVRHVWQPGEPPKKDTQ